MIMKIGKCSEFILWFDSLPLRTQGLIDARIYRIEEYEHFGDCKYIGNGIAELRWKNGLRIYFLKSDNKTVLLLNGGGKNEQKRKIKKAKILSKKYAHNEDEEK